MQETQPDADVQDDKLELVYDMLLCIAKRMGMDSASTLPSTSVRSDVAQWNGTASNKWPYGCRQVFTPGFQEYLKGEGLVQATVDINVQGLGYLFELVDVKLDGGTEWHTPVILRAMLEQGTLRQLFQLPILGSRFSWIVTLLSDGLHFLYHE